ncbi:unnamed protein product [Cuscuta epithymum]
MYVYY